jgi:hypothetical protein|tara:strand:- start:57 stop:167 length:111 start_codon:yes stop_codon:yes gene_type:complete
MTFQKMKIAVGKDECGVLLTFADHQHLTYQQPVRKI